MVSAPSKVELTIHHQFPGIELISPVYPGYGATCYLSPDQSVVVDSTTQVGYILDHTWYRSIGVLMYKLQRKNTNQSNEGKTTCTQLVLIWKVQKSGELYVYSFLMENDKDHVWNRDELVIVVKNCEFFIVQYGPIEDTWLLRNHTVLVTRVHATFEEECYKLEMIISKGSINKDTRRLWYIDYIDMDK
jgi:hypothetical protein